MEPTEWKALKALGGKSDKVLVLGATRNLTTIAKYLACETPERRRARDTSMLEEVEGAAGLKKERWLEKQGDGTTFPSAGSQLWVHFTVTVESSQLVVDSSRGEHLSEIDGITVYKPKRPFEMRMPAEGDEQSVFEGFTLALKTMSLGERASFLVPPELAYGEKGKGQVGPGEALELNLELMGIDGVYAPPSRQ